MMSEVRTAEQVPAISHCVLLFSIEKGASKMIASILCVTTIIVYTNTVTPIPPKQKWKNMQK